MEAEKNEERNDEKMRMDIERNTDSEKRLMGYITALVESGINNSSVWTLCPDRSRCRRKKE